MKISIIAAVAANNAIGYENKLLYWLPNDLKRFKNLTTGHTIIMGRRTFESLPKGALPNRRNLILSRQQGIMFENAECFTSLQAALSHCQHNEEVYIIGGASVYKEALSIADNLYLTHIEDIPSAADAFFPEVDPSIWKEVKRETHKCDEKHAYAYSFVDYERR